MLVQFKEAMTPMLRGIVALLLMVGMCGRAADVSPERINSLATTNHGALDGFLMGYVSKGFIVHYSAKATASRSLLEGPFRVTDTNGTTILQGTYRGGVWHGEMLGYHANGRLESRRLYVGGKCEGTGADWGDGGRMVRTIQFTNGKKDGIESYWTGDGALTSRILWKADVPEWVELYEAGVLQDKLAGEEAVKYFRRKALESIRRDPSNAERSPSSR